MNNRRHANWISWRRLGPTKFCLRWTGTAPAAALGFKVLGPLALGRPIDLTAALTYITAFTVLGFCLASWAWRHNEAEYQRHQGTRA